MAGAKSAFSSESADELYTNLAGAIEGSVKFLGTKNFLHGDAVRMTDYMLFEMVEILMAASGGDDRLAQQYPTLAGYHARILAQPTFGAYYNSDACLKAPFFPSMAKLQM